MGEGQIIAIFGIFLFLVCITGQTALADNIKFQENSSDIQRFLPDPPYIEGSILVQAAKGQDGSVSSLSDIHAAIGATVTLDYSSVDIPGLCLVKLPEGLSVPDAIAYYSSVPSVLYAEPDYYVRALKTPDDPEFWRQWGLSNTGSIYKENTAPGIPGADISALSGWEKATGTNGIIIAVLDSGADIGHPDLAGNIWSLSESGKVLHGINILEERTVEPWDDFGHGTHCAGIIGMVGNNGLGGAGVAWNTTIMPIKVLDYQGSGKLSGLALGMAYATMYNASVVSCSFGTEYSRVTEDIIRQSPALFVCAAGNFGVDLKDFQRYPACYNLSNVIAVAATDAEDNLSWFSNYGNRTVHVAAPGSEIYSTSPSAYAYTPIFEDPTFSEQNFTLIGNWTLIPGGITGELPYVQGVVTEMSDNSTFGIDLKQSVYIPDDSGDVPDLVWDIRGNLTGYEEVELSYDDETWMILREGEIEFSGDTWKQAFIPLNSVYPNSDVFFRFSFSVWDEDSRADISVRNIRVGYRGAAIKPEYCYMNGTSMATPMVSGLAGLIKGIKSDLSAEEIKQVIMETTDPLPSLKDKIITGGRVNLSAALNSLKEADRIPLLPGWNHISIPGILAPGYDTAEIFAGVNSSGHSILVYLNNTAGYRILSMHDPVIPLQGYWIYSTDAIGVPVRFSEPMPFVSREIPAGWSSVGGWAETDLSANETFHTLRSGWSYVTGFDAAFQQYEEPIIRGGSGNQSDTRPVHPYSGYWLYCSENGTYQNGFG